ncbi:MAG: NAD(P)/FAD-dependent oxidoreductase [Deltaproteobacteria bacterium]|nr:NAD(P)/FAD-dependent oxidoreductase [Deltaproteobacteria bacterium]MBW2386586.1 NAD(P)/FAD-dependent oxidoreductase [Deltaproteobacteria bacterium]
MKIHDVVIVGGGHNGLACAGYLGRAGLDVLVLERKGMVGGSSVTEETWPGYQISSAAYVSSLMPPQVVSELELERFGYRVTILDPDYWVPYPDGTSLTLWGDVQKTAEEIARYSKKDAESYIEFDKYFARVGQMLKDLLFVIPPNLALRDLAQWLSLGGKVRHWSASEIAELVRLFTISGADFLDEWFEDDRVKGALGTQTIMGAWCGPMSPGSAYVLLHHWIGEINGHAGAWGWVHGGMGAVARSLADSARSAGATIREASPVHRVVVEGGRATGVELEDGSIVRARQVISNAHPVTTYLDLIGEENLSDDVLRSIRRYRTRSGSVKVNFGLGELPKPTAWKGATPGTPHMGILAISPSLEYLERAWDDAKYGRCSEHPYIEAIFPTAIEPGLAPEGKHIGLCFTQFGPYDLADGSWETEREVYGQSIIRTLDEYCPGFSDSVEHMEVLAPPDIEERFGLIGGSITQGEMAVDQMFCFRPIPGYADYRTPIDGLYMCGGGTHPGGGVTGVPGRNCARVVGNDRKWGRLKFWRR